MRREIPRWGGQECYNLCLVIYIVIFSVYIVPSTHPSGKFGKTCSQALMSSYFLFEDAHSDTSSVMLSLGHWVPGIHPSSTVSVCLSVNVYVFCILVFIVATALFFMFAWCPSSHISSAYSVTSFGLLFYVLFPLLVPADSSLVCTHHLTVEHNGKRCWAENYKQMTLKNKGHKAPRERIESVL